MHFSRKSNALTNYGWGKYYIQTPYFNAHFPDVLKIPGKYIFKLIGL